MKEAPEINLSLLTYLKMAKQNAINLRSKIFLEYGDIAWRKIKGNRIYTIANPDFAKHILLENKDNYFNRHFSVTKFLTHLLGDDSLITSSNPTQWHRDRLTANVNFDPKVYFEDYAFRISSYTNNFFKKWKQEFKDGQYIDIIKDLDPIIFGAVTKSLFFEKIDSSYLQKEILEVIKLSRIKAFSLPFFWYFSSNKKKWEFSIEKIRKITFDIVNQRVTSTREWDDLIGSYIHEYKLELTPENVELIRHHVVAFFAMSYFTSAGLLHWILVELSRHPDIEQRITDEVNNIMGNRLPTYQDFFSLKYLARFIKEILRLYPVAFTIPRTAKFEDTLGEFKIPKNSGLIISPYHLHRHPDFWDNPEGFNPERFLDNPIGQSHQFAYLPFGAGDHRCPGGLFATMEVTLITALFVQNFRLNLPPLVKVEPTFTTPISMRPNVNKMCLRFK